MPITPVGVGTFTINTVAITPPLPGSLAVNDLLVLPLRTINGQAITIPTPNGGTWVEAPDSPQENVATGVRLTVFYSRYNGTQGNPTTSDSGTVNIGQMMAFRGVTVSDPPIDVTAGSNQGSTTAGSIPGDTSTVDGVMVVAMSACDLDASSTTNASGWTNASLASITEMLDEITASGVGGGFAAAYGIKETAGAFNATTWTQAASGGLANLMIALIPQERRYQVAFAEFETPDAGSSDRRYQVSFTEFEVPDVSHRYQLSFAELEAPEFNRQYLMSFAELEVPDAPGGGPTAQFQRAGAPGHQAPY